MDFVPGGKICPAFKATSDKFKGKEVRLQFQNLTIAQLPTTHDSLFFFFFTVTRVPICNINQILLLPVVEPVGSSHISVYSFTFPSLPGG